MKSRQYADKSIKYTGNDEIYPTEIIFSNGWKVRIVCSEDGQKYLRVEPS